MEQKQKHFSMQTQNKQKTITTNIGRNRIESMRVTNAQNDTTISDKIEWDNIKAPVKFVIKKITK